MSDTLVRAPRASVDVVIAPKPFTPALEVICVEEGASLAQLLLRAVKSGALAFADLPRTEIYIDGLRLVERSAIREVVPRAGETVNIVVLPQGAGSGGRKNPFEMALQLAVMVAAFAIAGPAGPLATALTNAGIAAGSLAASSIEVAAMAAINLTGAVALRAIFGPTPTDANQPQYSLENQSNQARQRQMMPLCLGERRWSFDECATAFSTIVGQDVWLTVMYGLHYGPCTLADLKIGETLASAYPASELTIETFLTPGPRVSQLYPSRIDQQSLQDELDPLHADWSTETSGINATRLEVDFYWPQLIYTTSGGVQEKQDAVIYMEYSVYGANAWQPVPGYPAGTDADGNAYPAGSLWIQEKTENPTRQTVGWDVPLGQYDVRIGRRIRRGGDTSRSVDDVTWTALRTINTSEPAINDDNLAIIVIKAMASQDFSGSLGVVSGVVTTLAPIPNAQGVWQGDPTTYDATNWQPTSNAAALARYMLTGYPAASPLTAAQIDASLAEHYQTIETMDWHGGLLVNSDASQEDVLVKLGKLGRCYFYWNGSAVCCAPDYEKPAARQVFTGRNAQNYQYKRIFPDPVHAVYVNFTNADEDWKDDGLFVYNDGYTAANATLLEGLTLDYACTGSRALREGRVYLAKRKLLTETHQWTAGVDSIASTFGDRVVVRHISTLFGIGEARVQFRRWAGELVAGVRLDTEVKFEAGQTYTVDVRRFDQVIRGLPLTTTPGATRDLVFSVPVEEANAPLKGDLVIIGQTGVVSEDVEIIDITPKPDGTADIIAQSYQADGIVAAETGPIPPLQSALTARVAAPVPVILGANGSPNGVVVAFDVVPQRQATIQGFTARWRRSPDEDATSTWNTLPSLSAAARTAQTPPIPDAQISTGSTADPYNVDVEIRTILSTGEISQPAQALNIVVQKGVLAPTNFAALGVVRTAQDGSSYPAIQVDCDPLIAGSSDSLVMELQPSGSDPAAWKASASGPFAADVADGDLTDVSGGQTYDVRARWRTSDGWYSQYVTQAEVSVPTGALVAANTVAVGDREAAVLLATVDQATSDIETSAENDIASLLAQARQATGLDAATYAIGLIGGLNDAKTGFVIDATTFQVVSGESMSDRLASIAGDITGAQTNITVLQQQSAASAAAIGTEQVVRAQADSALSTLITSLTATVGGVSAAVTTEATTRATADTAIAASVTALSSTVGSNTAAIQSEAVTRASADGALTSSITSLSATVGSNTAAISQEAVTRATNDNAITATVTSLSSTVDTNTAAISSEAYTRAQADQATTAQLNSLTSTVGTNTGAISSEAATRVSNDSALSSQISSVQATANGNTASINAQASAIATMQGQLLAYWSITAAAGSTPAYISVQASGYGSSIAMAATSIALLNPSDGSFLPALTVANDNVYFANPIYIGQGDNHMIVGPGLDSDGKGLLYLGPSQYDAQSATSANGLMFRADGKIIDGIGALPSAPIGRGASARGMGIGVQNETDKHAAYSFIASGIQAGGVWQASVLFGNGAQNGQNISCSPTGGVSFDWSLEEQGTGVVLANGTGEVGSVGGDPIAVLDQTSNNLIAGNSATGTVTLVLYLQLHASNQGITNMGASIGVIWTPGMAAAA